ncbi:hypothetical protein IH980_02425 [Patescibacteria group bacterium]|nr:hypothetical protein [Patescibacteria group bacterium]
MTRREKYFVDRRSEAALEKLERFARAEPLFGSAARVDDDGTILFKRWREVGRGTARSGEFTSLSRRRQPDRVQMRRGLKTKDVRSREIVQVESVESAIRQAGYILEGQEKVEQRQVDAVLERTRYLIHFFQERELSSISDEERLSLQQETMAKLSEVGLDPESVKLEVKLLMILWLAKASLGKDSLERDNKLITMQNLYAAKRHAMRREMEVGGNITLKYSQMSGALAFARASDRKGLFEVGDEVDNRLLRNVYIEGRERRVAGDYQYLIDKVDNLSWILGETLVKPYRPVALLGKGYLDRIKYLLEEGREDEGRREEMRDRGFVAGMRQVMSLDPEVGLFGQTLQEHAEVYS